MVSRDSYYPWGACDVLRNRCARDSSWAGLVTNFVLHESKLRAEIAAVHHITKTSTDIPSLADSDFPIVSKPKRVRKKRPFDLYAKDYADREHELGNKGFNAIKSRGVVVQLQMRFVE